MSIEGLKQQLFAIRKQSFKSPHDDYLRFMQSFLKQQILLK